MNSITVNQANRQTISGWLQYGWQTNKPLFLSALFSLTLLAFTSLGLLFDPRTLVGEPIWLKPTKFAISILLYATTLLWLLDYVQGYRRIIQTISWVTAGALFVELVLIGVQAWRGVRSHFNVATPFDTAVFSTMGTAILLLWIAGLVAMILLIRQKFVNPVWGVSLKLALAIGIIGAGLGGLMTRPTEPQLAQLEQGVVLEAGAHSVGVADGEGGKLPVVGWSTSGGDLRVGHFVGIHAMQVLPLIGWLIIRQNQWLEARKQKGLMWTAGLGYLGVVVLVTWQALQGEPLIYPSLLTMGLAVGLCAAVAGTSWWIIRR